MKPNARIASLLRELADAFDELDREEKPKVRRPRERTERAADDAARRVRDSLRKQGLNA